jgi:sigma-B regulation protein RsbQ
MTFDAYRRHNVHISGHGSRPIVFAHGFGCDQQMWRFVAPAFEADHRVVLFDHIGCGKSDLLAYDPERHHQLQGYAEDVVALLDALDLHDLVYVGHSVSAMIGLLASIQRPERFARLVLLAPSPCYLNDPAEGYVGGFERTDIEALIDLMESNMVGFANFLAPVAMGSGGPAALTDELQASLCAADPYINRRFATATFMGDHRAALRRVTVPALIVQCADDVIAPVAVGDYLHDHLAGSTLQRLAVVGHCPHMTHPEATIAAIRSVL